MSIVARFGFRSTLVVVALVATSTTRSMATSAAWTMEGDQATAYFGWSVATAGDVNGDGFSDVVVGAMGFDNPQGLSGRAYLYLGSASGLPSQPAWVGEGDAYGSFGGSVASAGDVNGDGFADVIVGDMNYYDGEFTVGRASVYLGSVSGLSPAPSWMAVGDQATSHLGETVATAGDVNGDGYSDVIVAAKDYDNGQEGEGRVYVYLGSASGLDLEPAWTMESDQSAAQLGCSAATAGDVNGDGYSDVIVGSLYYDNPEANEGRAFLFLGSPTGLSSTPAWTAESNQGFFKFALSVATAGDVNGDGFADVIVGSEAEGLVGRAYVYLGSATGLSVSPAWTAESDQGISVYSNPVATAGDVNGDGFSDVIVGARGYDVGGDLNVGRAYVYLGSASGLASSAAWIEEGTQAAPFRGFGASVATAGDVNGDGLSDVIVGSPEFTNDQEQEGRAYLYLGPLSGVPFGGSVTRLAPRKVTCMNKTTGQKIGDSTDESSWGCEALGLVVNAGDSVQTSMKGSVAAAGGTLAGSVSGMTPTSVFCQNLTTRTEVQAPTSATSWDCESMGLAVAPGDTVVIGARGKAD